ncbi:acyl-CoA dehydrogenase family protein [Castellaniella sp. GW247-6E4]|uniref:acyl-CoA dehydrogenase family protein n=1 Tax=Castellaniella sp. GW247-6E4 TaxID=3140380 RepID=UPI0033151C2B
MSTDIKYDSIREELVIFRDHVRRFIAKELAPHEDRWAEQQYPDREAWEKLGEMGMLLSDVPDLYGGGGATFAHECVVLEELARVPVNSLAVSVHDIVAHYILSYGSEEQKLHWLPAMACGKKIAAIGMSEPGAGSDLQSIKTNAVRDGGEYIINGSKTFISNGYMADLICLAAKTDQAAGARGISLIIVETEGLKGFRCGRILNKLGRKGQDTSELFFDDVRVPVGNLLGPDEGAGFAQMMEQLPWERTIIAAEAVAVMERAVEITTQYTKDRRAFGAPLFAKQNTRFKLAECATFAKIARIFLTDCICRVMAGTLDNSTASMAKWWTTQMEFEVTDECLQLHGGYGYMMEYPIAKLFADGRLMRIAGGSNEIMKEVIARAL